jgi:thiol-disulfide isomerase/thioredoxin
MRSLTTLAAFLAFGVSALAIGPVPRAAKEFDFVDANGKHTLLSSYKGKVVLIQFLLTTCPHCQAMSRDVLNKLQTELGPKGFQAVGVVFNDPEPGGRSSKGDMAKDYQAGWANSGADRHQFSGPLNFPISYASRETILSFVEASVMDRLMFPHVVVVDRKGQVRSESKTEGTADLQNEAYLTNFIGGLLKESATSSSATKKAPVVAATVTK